ncbi:MAG TPA: plastocyanin/azurin family copper-binding protein [Chloroflexia bacterium]|nr:plastocyanin/azurin family copper-binding protein [Chloroflexia bacterium]
MPLPILLAPVMLPVFRPAPSEPGGIDIRNYTYSAPTLRVAIGSEVSWTNRDNDTHNIAFDQGPELFVSPVLSTGNVASFTFTKPGTYHYFCEWHPQMQGQIVVDVAPGTVLPPPLPASITYPETGNSMRGEYLEYWQKNGGLPQQGFPISEEMQEKSDTDGKFYTIQYMERSVFEMHPENKAPYEVLLSLLGNFEYKKKYPNGAPGQQPNTSKGSIQFKETGKRLGGRFLEYWQKNGGLAQQGFPISDEFQEKSDLNGKTYLVQYFERAVFEYHPENKAPYDVLLSQLGRFRYDKLYKAKLGGSPSGIHPIGISSGPGHYPLLAGPHAAPGANVWIYDQDPDPVVNWMGDLGSKWALHQLSWYQIEFEKGKYRWDKIDKAVEALYKAGVNIVLHPVHSPPWASDAAPGYPNDPAEFGKFMSVVAARYKGKVAGYQIWNEPNLLRESGQYVSASRYAGLLKAGYTAVKAADPSAVVIAGVLTPNGKNDPFEAVDDVIFLKRLYAYNSGELKGYFDVLGAHPGSNANPPEKMWPDDPGPGPGWNNHGSFYFRRVEQIRQVMVENGDAEKQIWATEFGWMSMEKPPVGFEFASQTTEQEQADFIGRAFRMGRDRYSWMGPMFVFQLNFALPSVSPDATDERIGWGLIRRDGSKRPSFGAFQQYAREYNGKK